MDQAPSHHVIPGPLGRRIHYLLACVIGRRGAFLLFLALLDLVYGYSLLFPTQASLTSPTYVFIRQVAHLAVWGGLWLAVGLICAVSAFRHNDAPGFAAAMLIKILWGAIFFLGWVFADVERGYLSSAIWLAFAAVVGLLSSWREPEWHRRFESKP